MPKAVFTVRGISACVQSFIIAYKLFWAEDVNVTLQPERARCFNSFSQLKRLAAF